MSITISGAFLSTDYDSGVRKFNHDKFLRKMEFYGPNHDVEVKRAKV